MFLGNTFQLMFEMYIFEKDSNKRNFILLQRYTHVNKQMSI